MISANRIGQYIEPEQEQPDPFEPEVNRLLVVGAVGVAVGIVIGIVLKVNW